MKIVHGAQIDTEVQENAPRQGTFAFRRLLEGTPGTPENFIFRMTKLDSGFYSPRHCHNFDQIRFILDGWTDFSRNGKLRAGMVGYFPEGAAYGPQSVSDDALILALQFGGASGAGYLSAEEVEEGGAELRKTGRFERGKYIWVDARGKERQKDAYAAVWEHMNGRRFVAPKRRYRDPIFMDPAHYAWVDSRTEPGVAHKHLGSFSEAGTALDVDRIAEGATMELRPHGISFVLSGAGRIGGESLTRYSAVQLDYDERAVLRATSRTELLHITLPDLRWLSAGRTAESYDRLAS
jgi:hypothetical protein